MNLNPNRSLNTDALRAMAACEPDAFRLIASRVTSSDDPPTIRITELVERFVAAGAKKDLASAVASQLVAIAIQRRVNDVSVADIFDAVLGTMSRNGLGDSEVSWFTESRDVLVSLLEMESVRLVAKALHLSTEADNLYIRAKIISDIRPIFNAERERVVGAIVMQLLRLRYLGPLAFGGENEITLSLDLDDLKKIRDEIDRAILKSNAAREFLAAQLEDNQFVVGEETYSYD